MKKSLMLLFVGPGLLWLVGCAPTTPIQDARSAYFASVEGRDADCEGWLEWCVAEGYPQEACEERNEFCVNGEWVRGEGDDSEDPCDSVAATAHSDCIEAGGSQEECREAAAEAHEACSEE